MGSFRTNLGALSRAWRVGRRLSRLVSLPASYRRLRMYASCSPADQGYVHLESLQIQPASAAAAQNRTYSPGRSKPERVGIFG